MNYIGQNIKKIRLLLEMTQIDFAKTLHITQSALSKIEKGTDVISIEILERAADVYSVTLDWLILDKGESPTKISLSVDSSKNLINHEEH
jgi:transcriptional regulator with XRE-family HTH domain